MFTDQKGTFTAGEALGARRRVKIKSGTTTTPPEVMYADAGEAAIGITEYAVASGALVTIKLINDGGIFEVCANPASAIAVGNQVYAAADGKVAETPSGRPVGIAIESASADGDLISCILTPESPGEKVMVPIPLTILREVASDDIPALAAHGGILAKDSTPNLEFSDGDTDSALRLDWAADGVDPVVFQLPIPDIDPSQDLVVHLRAAMGGTTNTPTIASDTYFNEGDTKVEDVSAAITGTAFAEYTITVAAADIPDGTQTVTIELTPGAHDTDTLLITAIWIEYVRTALI